MSKKGVFGQSVSSLGLSLKHLKRPENLKGAKEEADSPKTPFSTTVSPHDAFAAPLARPHKSFSPPKICTHTNRKLLSPRGSAGVATLTNTSRKRAEIGFRGVRFQTPNSVSFLVLTEFWGANSVSSFSAYYLCARANSPSFSQNSPSLPQNSVSSFFRNSTLETVFRPFPNFTN